jgi:hypothetical protein
MRADRADHGAPLPDQKIARPVEQQRRLALRRLDRNEAHARPLNRFADRLRVRHVVLLALHVRLDELRRHQAHVVAERRDLARPVVRRVASLDPDQSGR